MKNELLIYKTFGGKSTFVKASNPHLVALVELQTDLVTRDQFLGACYSSVGELFAQSAEEISVLVVTQSQWEQDIAIQKELLQQKSKESLNRSNHE